MQLELEFDKKNELDLKFELVNQRIDNMKLSSDKVRKGVFARTGEFSKVLVDLLSRVEELEEEVARLKRNVSDRQIEWKYATDGNLFSLAVS